MELLELQPLPVDVVLMPALLWVSSAWALDSFLGLSACLSLWVSEICTSEIWAIADNTGCRPSAGWPKDCRSLLHPLPHLANALRIGDSNSHVFRS